MTPQPQQHDPRAWPEADVLAASLVRQKDALLKALKELVAAEDRFCAETGLSTDDAVTAAVTSARRVIADAEQTRKDAP